MAGFLPSTVYVCRRAHAVCQYYVLRTALTTTLFINLFPMSLQDPYTCCLSYFNHKMPDEALSLNVKLCNARTSPAAAWRQHSAASPGLSQRLLHVACCQFSASQLSAEAQELLHSSERGARWGGFPLASLLARQTVQHA